MYRYYVGSVDKLPWPASKTYSPKVGYIMTSCTSRTCNALSDATNTYVSMGMEGSFTFIDLNIPFNLNTSSGIYTITTYTASNLDWNFTDNTWCPWSDVYISAYSWSGYYWTTPTYTVGYPQQTY